ncbi:zinc metalloprotease EGY, chloroplastic [Marchantia polymorpha subsp. ruderalis]|uniref:Peptidase M50 domain-containing protein n=1 Tax=Marchantia polymorpha TaxID=3197 RepID=A0A2R6X7K0_MARPO|nr:hypothetical protein MARPO_0031s0058 [Marchantia polymorpha]BBN01028.1 hypothetical protein Mp_2g04020 [Marchantia polymorpha subsp. ruderalis]|eukprot:PTQ42077.1 hypothetical protein MARPO_0031s0058 [Marchantia polymorpha]
MSVCQLAAAGLPILDAGGVLKKRFSSPNAGLRSCVSCVGNSSRWRSLGAALPRRRLGFTKEKRLKTSVQASAEDENKNNDTSESKKEETSMNETHDPSVKSSSSEPSNLSTEQAAEDDKVSMGSPLPGVKSSSETARLPKEVIDTLRDQVFGFDTFFVTGQEPYEGGVLFKGNLRGEAGKSYTKLEKRLQEKFGGKYRLFLLSNPTDERPVAVIVPKESLEPGPGAVPEWAAAGAFGLVCIFTILLRNAPTLQLALLTNNADPTLISEGLLGGAITAGVLLAHEAGHLYAAKQVGAKLSVPYFIPSWQLGSFGAITRITNIIRNRSGLLRLAAAGPLAGAFFGLTIILIGLLLPPGEGQGIVVDAGAFHDSLLVGGLAKLILGDTLQEGAKVSVNPIVLSAWAGLLINAINSIPVGELDGGRVVQALWGRKAWSRLTGVSVGLLGLTGIFNDVSLYWVVLIVFLQRGPITPQSDELTSPDQTDLALGVAVLLLGLLVYLPYPLAFSYVLPPLA